jgi:DNA-binding transcriptional MerR regulator
MDSSEPHNAAPDATYSIQQVGERVGLSVHTLRYYERIGLLDAPARDAGGRRRYTYEDVAQIALLILMRDTGMPLQQIQEFVALMRQGDPKALERRRLLEEHQAEVQAQIDRLCENLAVVQRPLLAASLQQLATIESHRLAQGGGIAALHRGIEVEQIDVGAVQIEGEGAPGGSEEAASLGSEHAAQFGQAVSEVGQSLVGLAVGPEGSGQPVSLDGSGMAQEEEGQQPEPGLGAQSGERLAVDADVAGYGIVGRTVFCMPFWITNGKGGRRAISPRLCRVERLLLSKAVCDCDVANNISTLLGLKLHPPCLSLCGNTA